jgi:hypothetical protein
MTKVKCTVNSCDYWGEGQICNAEEIWVKNDISGDSEQFSQHYLNAEMEMGADFDNQTFKNAVAKTSPQTCCETMRLKKSVEQ